MAYSKLQIGDKVIVHPTFNSHKIGKIVKIIFWGGIAYFYVEFPNGNIHLYSREELTKVRNEKNIVYNLEF